MPDVPTIAESGLPGYESGALARAHRPEGPAKAVVDRIGGEVNKALKLKDTADQLQNDGRSPAGGTPEQFAAQIKKEIGVWRKVAADAGVKAE
jgi:tripartite-type tricarboxylate transporter receptor subunit TctC